MATHTGILTVKDLLTVETQSVLDYGVDTVVATLQADLDAHNRNMVDMVSALATPTTERVSTYGAISGGELQKVDGQGRAPTQKAKGFAPVAFPLDKYQFNLGWTNDYVRRATPADLARQTVNARTKHRVGVIKEIKRAFFGAANYSFYDYLVDDLELAVKRLVNADGASIPPGPGGETFDGATHTHYDAIEWASADADAKDAAVKALINDVIEHGHGAMPALIIARGDEGKMAGVADFEPYKPVQIVSGTQADSARGTLDTRNLYNRAIGILASSGAEVWVKPWAVTGYFAAVDMGAPASDKPLAYRQPTDEQSQGLTIKSLIEIYPLVAEVMEDEFGFGVKTRTNGAVLFLGSGTYASPTIT